MSAKKGDKVTVEYTGTLENGEVFDSSEKHGKPLEFELGSGQVIKGFDDALMGMKEGEEKKISLKPEEAYGEPKAELVKQVPRDQLPKEQEPKEGMVLLLSLPDGKQVPAKIAKVGENEVSIDLNHPLAGKTLNFTLKLVKINS